MGTCVRTRRLTHHHSYTKHFTLLCKRLIVLAAAANNKVSEARPKKLYVHLAKHSKSPRNDGLHKCIVFLRRLPTRVCIAACVKFVHSYNASVIRYGTTSSCHTLPPTHLHAVFASRRSTFRFAYRLESVSALHGSRPSNTRCGPQLRSTSSHTF